MIPEVRTTLNNLGPLFVQRCLCFISSLLFAAIVPRLMGAQIYGQYALITSLSIWFVLFSTMGFSQIIRRYVPQFTAQGAWENLGKFFGSLLTLRLASSALGAGLYLLLTVLWLRDLDPWVLAIMGGTIFIRAATALLFELFLGLNQAGRWGMNRTVRRWISLLLLVPGFYLAGLRGACLGLFLTEVAVLALGLWWAREHLSWSSLRVDFPSLAPCLGFGLIFFASDLINAAFSYSGELLVRTVTRDYGQVSYFGLAFNVYSNFYLIFLTFTLAFLPLLGTLLAQGERAVIQAWVERLIKGLAMAGVSVLFATLLLGDDLVPLVLGAAYRPVVANLPPLMLALLAQALSVPGEMLALTFDRPMAALTAAGLRLAAYWALGPPLIAGWGSLGGCLAVLAAMTLHASYITWRMRAVAYYSLKNYALAAGLGALFLPLLWLRSSWSLNLGLFAGFLVAYGGLLFVLRVISQEEIAAVWRVVRWPIKGD